MEDYVFRLLWLVVKQAKSTCRVCSLVLGKIYSPLFKAEISIRTQTEVSQFCAEENDKVWLSSVKERERKKLRIKKN
jgi:hypothetical protein